MDTYVVLPEEFFLSLSRYMPPHASAEVTDQGPGPGLGPGRTCDHHRRPAAEARSWGLSVWTAVHLPVGSRYTASQGTTVMLRLAGDVGNRQFPQEWKNFACFEEIREGPRSDERHCNWACFLRSVVDKDEANMLVYKIKGKPVFEVIKSVPAFAELSAFFQMTDHSICSILSTQSNQAQNVPGTQLHRPSRLQERSVYWPVIPRTPPSRKPSSAVTSVTAAAGLSLVCYSASPRATATAAAATDEPKQAPTLWTSPRRGKERTSLPCEVCGKSFDRPSLLRRHMRTHTGEKPHSCTVCGKAFSTSSSLNTHCRIHSGEKPHVCGVCGKRFTASSNLYYHRMTHRKDKPHKCTMCCKSFPTPGDLRSHMFVHSGSWPFKCQLCNRGFSKHTNLKNHIMLHTGEKPHMCALCGKRFALICNLKSHSKTHQRRRHPPQEQCLS